MEKKMYYLVSDNADMVMSCDTAEAVGGIISGAMEGVGETNEIQFTVTPVWMTEEEYEALPGF